MSKRFNETIVEGLVLIDNLAPRLAELPQLAADHASLGEVLAEVRELASRREAAKAELREITQRRRQAAKRAADLRRRLTAGLQAALGADSPQLLEFGAKPLPRAGGRPRLTPLDKAARAAARAVARAAALRAAPTPSEPTAAA